MPCRRPTDRVSLMFVVRPSVPPSVRPSVRPLYAFPSLARSLATIDEALFPSGKWTSKLDGGGGGLGGEMNGRSITHSSQAAIKQAASASGPPARFPHPSTPQVAARRVAWVTVNLYLCESSYLRDCASAWPHWTGTCDLP